MLDAVIALHVDWLKFNEARARVWPSEKAKKVNMVLPDTGTYQPVSVLAKRSGPMRLTDKTFDIIQPTVVVEGNKLVFKKEALESG
jgi:hypothetical protein